ncbi:periplasmic sensor diguanylate cyclase/phosphodiesterase [Rhizobium azibense]|uniref:Periplasmic sensor diguanylate cyclase/phosphodiesterase n=1 Tax=Rhizobium azibense TaxID=1136135 RepID=A0A4V2VCJ5_9HYPH|nr:EAL domain-containing protein [Rhizobium azibense]TCU29045.1 periplasmic sensor diguanylate cyclase/phosphodiesterase [Rhizobium azibense]TCU37686.1 periplasmic sensor diguanylate cyclase/phosphodiesterase [Rhizobium azibense]
MKHPKLRAVFLLLILPAAASASIWAALAIVLSVATGTTDEAAIGRQRHLAEMVVAKLQEGVAHDQESVTVWDDAVRKVSAGDQDWMEMNLGKWMFTYFQHERAFVVTPEGRAVYAFANDEADRKEAFRQVHDIVIPLAQKLRRRLVAGDENGVSDQVLSIGESDLALVNGHPAVVSVKPIVSDSGDIEQDPAHVYLHVAVRYLDGNFLSGMAQEYLFDDLRFTWARSDEDGRSYAKLKKVTGNDFGYFSWRPFTPGAAVESRVGPTVAMAGIAVFAAMSAMGGAVLLRSRHLQHSRSELERLAAHDGLTGLVNRSQFQRHLSQALAASLPGKSIAVLFIDLDRFKQVNDTLGHAAGDELLVAVAGRLLQVCAGRLVARLGGDEFTVILDNVCEEDVVGVCEHLLEAMRRPFEMGGGSISIGASIGVAAGEFGTAAQELTRKADIALYSAKGAGRNCYAIFGAHMDDLLQARREIEYDLRRAVTEGKGLELHFQPVYSADNGALCGAEALLRWSHPTRGRVGPDIFIPIAEECGLINAIGEFVLRETCLAAQRWPALKIAANASPKELQNESYALKVMSMLKHYGINPEQLEIEITEGTLLDGGGQCQKNIEALRSIGVHFALDDFGTGFSSFARLQNVSVDRIKIDKSFVDRFGREKDGRAIIEAMIGLARAKGLKTTAEGVETDDQRMALKELGCDHLQGYLLSMPLSKEQFDKLVGGNVVNLRSTRM